ncbi:MAG: hypothetical protein WAV11_03740 [Minisyncoccia bacterium]
MTYLDVITSSGAKLLNLYDDIDKYNIFVIILDRKKGGFYEKETVKDCSDRRTRSRHNRSCDQLSRRTPRW